MRTLVIDTATPACSVALFEGDNIIAAHYEVIGRGHAERLVPFINDLPHKGRADHIAVNIGPGSFTGIRVGISAARALSFAWDVPCTGYGCLDLVGAMAAAKSVIPSEVDVIMNGGHGEFFFQQFDIDSRQLAEPLSMPLHMAAEISNAPIVAGDSAALLADMRGNRIIFDYLPDARQWYLIADHIPLPNRPFYGRAPDAKLPGNKAV